VGPAKRGSIRFVGVVIRHICQQVAPAKDFMKTQIDENLGTLFLKLDEARQQCYQVERLQAAIRREPNSALGVLEYWLGSQSAQGAPRVDA